MEETIIKKWFDDLNNRNWSELANVYHEDAVIQHQKDGTFKGGEGVVELAKKWLEAIPDIQLQPLNISREGDVIIAYWRAEGKMIGPLRDIPPTGEKVVLHGFTSFRFSNGKIAEHWATIDFYPLTRPLTV